MPRVTITVPGKTPQPYRFQLDRQAVSLGRGSENDIAIDCGSVSVKHATMMRVDGGYELRDAGSTNGIKLDGDRRDVIALRTGLSVKLGDVAFDFVLNDEELDELAKERSQGASTQGDPEEDDDDFPSPRASRREPASAGGGVGMWLVFLILAAIAFGAGMAVRFQKDTGISFLDALNAKPEISAPANEEAAAPPSPTSSGTSTKDGGESK